MLNSYQRRKFRVRSNIAKNNKGLRPRVIVTRSNKNLHAQLLDQDANVIASFSTLLLPSGKKSTGVEKAKSVGLEFAKKCLGTGATKVVFDKGAYNYNGRVKALAEGCREGGLEF